MLKCGFRVGDRAPLAILEYVDRWAWGVQEECLCDGLWCTGRDLLVGVGGSVGRFSLPAAHAHSVDPSVPLFSVLVRCVWGVMHPLALAAWEGCCGWCSFTGGGSHGPHSGCCAAVPIPAHSLPCNTVRQPHPAHALASFPAALNVDVLGITCFFLSCSVALPHVCREGEVRPARPVSPAGTFDAEFALVSPVKEVLA